MIEIASYILNAIFASGYITNRGSDIDRYHSEIDKLKEKVYTIAIDANACVSFDNHYEKNAMQRQITTELHHLIADCQSFSKNHRVFTYDGIVGNALSAFKKSATGANANKSEEDRCSEINETSTALKHALDSFKINKKWPFAAQFWKKI